MYNDWPCPSHLTAGITRPHSPKDLGAAVADSPLRYFEPDGLGTGQRPKTHARASLRRPGGQMVATMRSSDGDGQNAPSYGVDGVSPARSWRDLKNPKPVNVAYRWSFDMSGTNDINSALRFGTIFRLILIAISFRPRSMEKIGSFQRKSRQASATFPPDQIGTGLLRSNLPYRTKRG